MQQPSHHSDYILYEKSSDGQIKTTIISYGQFGRDNTKKIILCFTVNNLVKKYFFSCFFLDTKHHQIDVKLPPLILFLF